MKLTSTPHQASFPRPAPFETPPAPARAGADVPPRVVHLAGNLLERLKQQIPPEKHRVIPPVGQFAQLRRDVALLVHQAVNIPVDFGFQVNDFRHRVRQTIRRAAAPGYAVFPQDGRDARRHVLQSRRVRQLAGDPLVEQAHLRQILFCPHRPPLLNRPSAPPAAISLFRRHLRRIFGILHRLRRILRGVLRHI